MSSASIAGIKSIIEDTSPKLGGNLDTNGYKIGVNTSSPLSFLHIYQKEPVDNTSGSYYGDITKGILFGVSDPYDTSLFQIEEQIFGISSGTTYIFNNNPSTTNVLSDYNNFSTAKWTLSGDFATDGNAAKFTFNTGSGSITQSNANQNYAVKEDMLYKVTVVVSAGMTLDTGALISIALDNSKSVPLSVGTNVFYIVAASSPDFTFEVSGASSGVLKITSITVEDTIGAGLFLTGGLDSWGTNDLHGNDIRGIADIIHEKSTPADFIISNLDLNKDIYIKVNQDGKIHDTLIYLNSSRRSVGINTYNIADLKATFHVYQWPNSGGLYYTPYSQGLNNSGLLIGDSLGYGIQITQLNEAKNFIGVRDLYFGDTSVSGTEVLADTTDFSTAKWSMTGDFAVDGTTAKFTKNTGSGTLTQTLANFNSTLLENNVYQLYIHTSGISNVTGGLYPLITVTGISQNDIMSTGFILPLKDGDNTIIIPASMKFTTGFVLSVSGIESSYFVIDQISLIPYGQTNAFFSGRVNVSSGGTFSGNGLELPHVIKKTASDNVRNSFDSEEHIHATTYTEIKRIILTNGLVGQARFKFDIKTTDSGTPKTAYAKIYRNGVALGSEQTDITGSYVTKSEDITQTWNPGDVVQIFAKVDVGTPDAVYIQNFRICYDDAATIAVASTNL